MEEHLSAGCSNGIIEWARFGTELAFGTDGRLSQTVASPYADIRNKAVLLLVRRVPAKETVKQRIRSADRIRRRFQPKSFGKKTFL